jgi:K+-sensing histidine kinase KdpD
MRVIRFSLPIAISLAAVCLVTALLWHLRLAQSPEHLVFYYLLPTALVAICWGNLPAIASAILGALCAAFVLYDPIFSFYVSGRLQIGEFVCFAVLAALTSKCVAEILRPKAGVPARRFPSLRLTRSADRQKPQRAAPSRA